MGQERRPDAKLQKEESFGDFQEVKEVTPGQEPVSEGEAPVRIKLPRGKEVIGIVTQRFGGNKIEVKCADGKTRNCRVPGRFSRTLWLRPRNIVLVQPWEFDDNKADVIFKYEGGAINQLKKRGMLNNLSVEF